MKRGAALALAATMLLLAACQEVEPADAPVSRTDAWGPAGDTRLDGVVRLVAGSNTAELELSVYQRQRGWDQVACEPAVAPALHPLILGASVWPDDQKKPFPALTLSLHSVAGWPVRFADLGADNSITAPCQVVNGIHLRALDSKEQLAELGVLPAVRETPRFLVVTVNGTTVRAPLRPICSHGETQSVTGCVYDPVLWTDQPGFPEIKLASGA